jgi:drug/metabolite transporter (DMT)-like permease
MTKLLLIPVLFVAACLFAGVYGALHNQISYTVCPEYFTKYKFHQFRIDDRLPDRVGAAIVGWKAAWWMGIVIGILLIPVGLVMRGTGPYFWGMIRVFGVVTITTMCVGIGALAVSYVTTSADVGNFTRYGNEITNDVAFAHAGAMHNCSYLGGLMGIISGGCAINVQRRRQREAT